MVTTLHTSLLTPLSYSAASASHPIPLSAANRFSRLKLSVYNPSYLSPKAPWMYVDSLNLRRTAPNCRQMTPAVSLSLSDKQMFSYKFFWCALVVLVHTVAWVSH